MGGGLGRLLRQGGGGQRRADGLYHPRRRGRRADLFSCLPWFDFTALTNEHRLDRDDTVPRLAWGKYFTENGRLMVHLSVEVNHRLLDGRHIGALKERLDDEIATLR